MSHTNKDERVEQLKRYDCIVALLPSRESAMSISTIHQRLAAKNMHVSKRTLQRDMHEIEKGTRTYRRAKQACGGRKNHWRTCTCHQRMQ